MRLDINLIVNLAMVLAMASLPACHSATGSSACTTAKGSSVAASPAMARSACLPSSGATVKSPSVSVSQVARQYGFASHSVKGKQIILRGQTNTLEMEGDSRRDLFNRVTFWLSAPPVRRWGRWTMLQSDVDKMLAPLLNPSAAVKTEGHRVVVLDAGHGGEDPGAGNPRYGIQEKRITLAIAGAVRDILQQRGLAVYLTRTGDRTMDLQTRCEYAAKVRADVFVSIHLNSAPDTSSSGIEVHILPPAGYPVTCSATVLRGDRAPSPGNGHDGANMVLGYFLQKSLLKYTGAEDRGVRRSRFYVVKYAPCPAALVECGFISNRGEAQKLLDSKYRSQIARALATGIVTYLNTVRRAQRIQAQSAAVTEPI